MELVELVEVEEEEEEEMDPQVELRRNRLEAACLEEPGTLALEVVEVVVGPV